ncbi:hypothetical protein EDB89DRAFT_1908230 [Lactarius sanguifluus]|nr:hypothetical protein EDB89DRAFT_1908230 [Lactarius sanguifluus]
MATMLREIHVEKFEYKHGVAICKNPKAVMKLWKEVDRLNAILSTNTEASARPIFDAFNIVFSGSTFTARYVSSPPIATSTPTPHLHLTQQVVVTGDTTLQTAAIHRLYPPLTPLTQTATSSLQSHVVPNSNLTLTQLCYIDGGWVDGTNGEGAATLSQQFHTKNIKLLDIAPYDIQVSYLAEHKSVDPPGVSAHVTFDGICEGLVNVTVKFRCLHLDGWFCLKPNNGESDECSNLQKTRQSPEVLQPAPHYLLYVPPPP